MRISSAKDLGLLVRDRRKAIGWTQAELAGRAGVKPLWISQFERGKTTVQLGLVFQTLKAWDIALWTGEAPSNQPMRGNSPINLDDILSNH